MSHFSVIVVTKDEPTDESLTEQLQPFHQFECTGIDDQYVITQDMTQELKESYEKSTTTRFKSPDGKLYDRYATENEHLFYRDPTDDELEKHKPMMGLGFGNGCAWYSKDWGDGRGYRPKVQTHPEGWEEVKIPTPDLVPFIDYVRDDGYELLQHGNIPDLSGKHKYSYATLDASGNVDCVIRRTNPNDKWDWWVVGGRYAGKFSTSDSKDEPGFNYCRTGNIDMDGLKRKAVAQREEWISEITTKAKCSRDELAIACALSPVAHAEWMLLEDPKPRGKEHKDWLRSKGGDYIILADISEAVWEMPELGNSQALDEWVAAAPPLTCFAFVRDKTWSEKGSMGWWGCVSDEKDDWHEQFIKLLADVPADHWLTVVDCHI